MELEQVIMELIVNSGMARSMAIEAIDQADNGDVKGAKEKVAEARKVIVKAHDYQTELIAKEARGDNTQMSLMMVHGQDHLMNAMVVIDLAEKFVKVYEKMN